MQTYTTDRRPDVERIKQVTSRFHLNSLNVNLKFRSKLIKMPGMACHSYIGLYTFLILCGIIFHWLSLK